VATGGGGYEIIDVVPRTWTHLVAIAAHAPVAPSTPVPPEWLADVAERFGRQAPARMTDDEEPQWEPWAEGHDLENLVDRAVMATRRAIFPLHGLDPWYD
jgi:acetoin utilization protein AcuC